MSSFPSTGRGMRSVSWKIGWAVGVWLGLLAISASPTWACYAIIVGRKASADGSVLVGHAEQNQGRRILNFRVVPRRQYAADASVDLGGGGQVPQVSQTWRFLWSEIPGTHFSDNFLNEWGVAVVSDYCPSREDDAATLASRGDLRDGGIGYMLRRLVTERARSAREGVELAGQLIERSGYIDSGRTYVIADPREAWLLAVVRGRHWAACRVPDDQVVLLPNYYVTDEVRLEDRENFLGAADLLPYAESRRWSRPGQPFRFDWVYGPENTPRPDPRRLRGQQLVMGREQLPWPPEELPLGVKPPVKMTVASVMAILRGVIPADRTSGSPTQEGAVFQLRDTETLPREIGCIYWRTSGEPSLGVMLPWYLGIKETPANYFRPGPLDEALTVQAHLAPPRETFDPDASLAWWQFQDLQRRVRNDLPNRLPTVRRVWDAWEDRVPNEQPDIERKACDLWQKAPEEAIQFLTDVCLRRAAAVDQEVKRL